MVHENLLAYDRKVFPDYWDVLREIYEAAKCPLIVSTEVDGGATLAASLQAGQGFAIVTSTFSAADVAKVPIHPTVKPFSLALLRHRDFPDKLASDFLDACREQFTQ